MNDQQLLMAFAQNHRGDLQALLLSFFRFLHEYTDLYVLLPNNDSPAKMGFRQGQAEAKIVQAFRAFPYKPLSSSQQLAVATKARDSDASKKTESEQEKYAVLSSAKPPLLIDEEGQPEEVTAVKPPPSAGVVPSSLSSTGAIKQTPKGNGGTGPGYYWTQTVKEVTVYIDLAMAIKGKDIECTISQDSLLVRNSKANQTILQGLFPGNERVDVNESSWSLQDGRSLLIQLIKSRETWWASVIRGHPEVDTQLVDSTKRVDEFDAEAQAAIRKIMVEQRDKELQSGV